MEKLDELKRAIDNTPFANSYETASGMRAIAYGLLGIAYALQNIKSWTIPEETVPKIVERPNLVKRECED